MSNEITGKSLTYVEADVDLYRITQFEAVRAGVAVAGWTLFDGANTALVGALNAALPSGRGARLTKTVSGADVIWRWTRMPNVANVSIVALLRSQVATEDMAVVARNTAAGTAYLLRLFGDALQIIKGVSGSYVLQASVAFPVVANENIHLRFDVQTVTGPGALLRGKAWRGAVSDEPTAFMVAFTDTSSPIAAAGAVGLHTNSSGSDVLCGHFRAKSVLGSAIETLRFAKLTDYLTRDIAAVPDLVEASLSPGTISLGESLGERATLTVSLKDHRGADLGELFGRGSQWGKVRTRGIFRRGQPVRVKRGLLGQPFAQFETRHYVFDSFSGPTPQGVVSLIAKDPLKLADDDRALAPKPNNGFLVAGISAAATGFTLSPSGIGNAEYPASGIGQIGAKEVFQFTRVGDVCTFTERGALGTGAQQHDAEDRVQVVLRYIATDPAVIISNLLINFAGVDASYIPLATWLTETSTFLQRLYTRHITEPTGVNKLVSELIEQAGLALWHDDKVNQLRLQVLRGIPVDAFLYTQANTMAGSLQAGDQPEKQITQCWTYYGMRNPLAPPDQTDNYRSALATVDLEAETLNGSPVIRTILGTWIAAFNRPAAQRVNDLQIGRFVKAPRKFSFDVMRYSGVEEPQPGGGYRVQWWGNQDEAGNIVNAPIQVTRVNPMADRVRAEAEEMLFKQFVADNLDDRVINLDSNINNVVVRTTHDSIYPAPTAQDIIDGVNLTVIIPDGVIVGSASTAARALDIGTFPTTTATGNTTNLSPIITNLSVNPTNMKVGTRVTGSGIPNGARILTIDSPTQITLNVNATATASGVTLTFWFYILLQVVGRVQGAGGAGGNKSGGTGTPGAAGGTALYTRHAINLTTTSGEIWGGGGGGGGDDDGGGGGGAGQLPGAAGTPGGSPGTTEAGGAAGPGAGPGGGPGLAGANGSEGTAGGAAGTAIDGQSFVSHVGAVGDIRGPQIN